MRIEFRSKVARENPCLVSPLHEGKLVLQLSPGECLAPGAPSSWVAPNGVHVQGNVDGWDGSFHDPSYHLGSIHLVAKNRHLGSARRALRAYAAQFVRDSALESLKLKILVRDRY